MSRNGRRRPARPRIEVRHASATPEETAAITAAIEQFLRDTSVPATERSTRVRPWLRAALYENAKLDPANANPWGDGEPWGRWA